MKKNIMKAGLVIFCLLTLSSCVTYHLTTQSLLTQFANTRKETKVNVIVVPILFPIAFPLFFPGVVTGNNLREITCLDTNENEHVLSVTNHTGVRITKKDGKRKTFYFDTLLIKDSTINGSLSHYLGLSIKPINLNDIEIIELQK